MDIWSPGEFTDEDLVGQLGARVVTAARRAHRSGYPARVRRTTPDDPVPSVELSSCTVRFLVPHELGYARTDAARGAREEAVALAVWAFRLADEVSADRLDLELDVGGEGAAGEGAATGAEPAVELAREILLDGVVHIGQSLGGTLAQVRRDLDERGLRWPLLAVEALAEQLDAYRRRGAHHRPEQVAELLAELFARQRAVARQGTSLRSRVLGTEEPAETPLRRVRLTGLGCRVTGTEEDRTAEVFLAHPDSGTVLVLRRRWEMAEGQSLLGAQLAGRRSGGATLGALAQGNVVTESAHRGASRVIRLATSRIARTTVTPSAGAWDDLPDALLVRDLSALGRHLADLPPRLIRARIEAEFVRAVAVREVVSIGYQPGDQRLDAVIADPTGTTALVTLRHDAVCPGALDALAEALAAGPRFVSGALRRTRGGIVIDPLAVVAHDTVTVPALAAGDGATALELGGAPATDPLASTLDTGHVLLAEVAHRGLRHLPESFPGRLRTAGDDLARLGLRQCADALRDLAGALERERVGGAGTAVESWADAQIRLLVTSDVR